MKILYVSNLFRPHVGGIETMITELANRFGRQHDVAVLSRRFPSSLPKVSRYRDATVYRVRSAQSEAGYFKLGGEVLTLSNKTKFDIIHVIGVRRPLPLFALLLARRWNIPVMMTAAGTDIPDRRDPHSMVVWEEGEPNISNVLKRCDDLSAVSNFLARSVSRAVKPTKKVRTLYAGINCQEYAATQPDLSIAQPYILSLRRLEPSKGVDLSIRAFERAAKELPEVRLVIAGKGSDERKLRFMVNASPYKRRISFIGSVSRERSIALLKSAAMTVVPSRLEGGGLVNTEANAVGCPLIAARQGGIPEYALSALFFSPENVSQLADCIRRIATDKPLVKKLVRSGIRASGRLDWETLAPAYLRIYEKLISNHQSPRFVPWNALTAKLYSRFTS